MSRMNETPAPQRRIRPVALSVIALVVALVVVQSALAAGAVSLTTLGAPYMENFDTLATSGTTNSSLPNGWWLAESGTNANGLYQAGTGSGNAGDTYSFGAASSPERALGGLQSGSLNPTIGAAFTNDTGSTVTTLAISYTGEQWRLGTLNRADRIDFQYSLDATSLTTGTWTDVDALDFAAPTTGPTVGVLDGNTAANRAAVSGQISGSLSRQEELLDPVDQLRRFRRGRRARSGRLLPDALGRRGRPVRAQHGAGEQCDRRPRSIRASPSPSASRSACRPRRSRSRAPPAAPTRHALRRARVVHARSGHRLRRRRDVHGHGRRPGREGRRHERPAGHDGRRSHLLVHDHAAPRSDLRGAGRVACLAARGADYHCPGRHRIRPPEQLHDADRDGDGNVATSDAILVFATGIGGSVSVGQAVTVSGRVTEFRPGGAASANLSTTEITSPAVTPGGPGVAIARTIIGVGGRVPPSSVIDDDATGDVETSGSFDPATDGIDFYESLEAMLLPRRRPRRRRPNHGFGEVWVLANDGAGAGIRTAQQGIVIGPADFNPERIQLDDDIVLDSTPDANVGDHFTADARRGARLQFRQLRDPADERGRAGRRRARAARRPGHGFRTSSRSRGTTWRTWIRAIRRRSSRGSAGPDRRQPRSPGHRCGGRDSGQQRADRYGVVADRRYARAVHRGDQSRPAARHTSSGRSTPSTIADGGEPGGNIRVGFLFRTDRGLAFVDRPGATSTTPKGSRGKNNKVQLVYSPGRIDPASTAWIDESQAVGGRVPLPRQDHVPDG